MTSSDLTLYQPQEVSVSVRSVGNAPLAENVRWYYEVRYRLLQNRKNRDIRIGNSEKSQALDKDCSQQVDHVQVQILKCDGTRIECSLLENHTKMLYMGTSR